MDLFWSYNLLYGKRQVARNLTFRVKTCNVTSISNVTYPDGPIKFEVRCEKKNEEVES